MKGLEYIGWYGYDRVIGLCFHPEEDYFHLVRLSRVHQEWEVIDKALTLNRDEMLLELRRFPAWPICMYIHFSDLVKGEVSVQTKDIYSAVLGVQVEDRTSFVAQQIPIDKDQLSVALLRRDRLQQAYDKVLEFSQRIVGLSFHPGVVWPLDTLIGVEEAYLPAIGAIIQHDQARGKDLMGWEDQQENDKQFSQYQNLLKVGVLSLISALIIIILGGGGSLWLNGQNRLAGNTIRQHQAILTKLADQHYDIQQQRDFLASAEESKGLTASALTYTLDQVLAILPSNIYLEKFLCFPEKKELRKWLPDQEIKDIEGDIWIKGWANESTSLAGFLSDLSKIEMFSEVQMNSSTYDYQSKHYEFVISINLTDE